ncbi:MAG: hypothetical protein LKF36_09385 [Lactobacillus sp.]|jgi:hypothetical protein|nr:hypothetical protein [Lactobacillus sp.]
MMTELATVRVRKLTLWLFSFGLALTGLLSFGQVAQADSFNISRDEAYGKYTQVDSAQQALPLYKSPTSSQSNGTLSTAYRRWRITGAYVDSSSNDYKVSAYDLGNNQWLKFSDIPDSTRFINLAGVAFSDFFSNNAPYQLYSDAQTTQPAGLLNTTYDTWHITTTATDKNGNTTAYNLGADTWVRASDQTQLINYLNDPVYYDINAGVTTYDLNSKPTGTIQVTTVYGSMAYHYDKNNQMMLQVGNHYQWVYRGDMRQSSYGY